MIGGREKKGGREDEKKRKRERERTDEMGRLEGARRREGERSEGKEGNLQQGEPELLSERIVSSRHGKVSSADGHAVSILPIIVGLKGYLKKACIANSPPTCPISYEGPSRPLLPSQPPSPSLPSLPPVLSVNPQDPKRCVCAAMCGSVLDRQPRTSRIVVPSTLGHCR